MKWLFSGELATVIAALIGAAFGSLGAVLLQNHLETINRSDQERQALIREHLYGVQEGAEQLWWRVYNATSQEDRPSVQNYYSETTLYALGRMLASARILALKGEYPRVIRECPALGVFLRADQLGTVLAQREVRYYDRLALAETMMEQDGGSVRVKSFVEFHEGLARGDLTGVELLTPARELVSGFRAKTDEPMLAALCQLVVASSECTSVPPRLKTETCAVK